MPIAKSNDIELYYEESGSKDGEAILLVMGLGVQMIGWPPAMIGRLTDAGYRVIRFDNRDIGLSSRLDGKKAPNVLLQAILAKLRIPGLAPYRLTDMADDTIGLADALGIDRFHLAGVSMGGMIGQIVASRWPERVSSFTAIMTSTNNPRLPGARSDVAKALIAPTEPGATLDDAIERAVGIWTLIGTRDGGPTNEELRARITAALQRSNYPAGIRRQTAAIFGTGDLRKWTRKITAPTLVLHGTEDPLINVAGGKDVAATIAGSKLHLIDGLGHDLPARHLDEIVDRMIAHFRSASGKRREHNETEFA